MRFFPPSFLIASPQMRLQHFRQAVILLLEQSKSGAVGLIVNKLSSVPLQEFVHAQGIDIPSHVMAWNGGEDEQTKGIILHNKPSRYEYDNPGDVFGLSGTEVTLQKLISTSRKGKLLVKYPYRFIVGSTNWQPGQLEKQLMRGDWMQLPLDQNILFNIHAEEMWLHSLAVLGITPAKIIPQRQIYSH